MGECTHGNEPFTQRNHFSVGILSEMCSQLLTAGKLLPGNARCLSGAGQSFPMASQF